MPVSGTKVHLIQRLEKLMRDNDEEILAAERSPYVQLYDQLLQKIEYKLNI